MSDTPAPQKVAHVDAPVSNYYGGPRLTVYSDGSARLDIENYNGWWEDGGLEVSRNFALAFVREFGKCEDDAMKALSVLDPPNAKKPDPA